ncbi:hypothetical protein BT69DRAFT_1288820 [Atractiella rhizophila]|nr:hypothetical protein BT69DRAFT_1288820 [Atractiella rhizophila]
MDVPSPEFEAERARLLSSISQNFNSISVRMNALSREIEVACKVVDSAEGVWRLWEGWRDVHGAGREEKVPVVQEGLGSSSK